MTRALLATLMASFLCLAPQSSPRSFSTETESLQEETFTLDLGKEGMAFEKFVVDYAQRTKKRVFYDQRRIQNKRITGMGSMTFKTSDMEHVYSSIFLAHDMAVFRIGDPDLSMVVVQDIKTSQSLKANARFLTLEELENTPYTAEVVSVVVPVEHADVEKCQRALNNIVQDHRSGFVHPVPTSSSLVVTSFPNQVKLMVGIIRELDRQAGLAPKKPSADSVPDLGQPK